MASRLCVTAAPQPRGAIAVDAQARASRHWCGVAAPAVVRTRRQRACGDNGAARSLGSRCALFQIELSLPAYAAPLGDLRAQSGRFLQLRREASRGDNLTNIQGPTWAPLREMLGEEYVIKSNGQYLILKRQKQAKSEVSGVIRATNSGERLANVTIYDRKTLRATTTDSSGYYQSKVKKNTELVVVRLGYRDTI